MTNRTEDGRYIVVDGRRWRAEDPELPADLAASLKSALGKARSGIKNADSDDQRQSLRDRVQLAKEGLGERGTPWWELAVEDRVERARERLARLN